MPFFDRRGQKRVTHLPAGAPEKNAAGLRTDHNGIRAGYIDFVFSSLRRSDTAVGSSIWPEDTSANYYLRQGGYCNRRCLSVC